MHVGMNLMFLVPGEVGGSEPLLTNLARAISEAGHDVTVYAVAGFTRAYPEIEAVCEVVEVPWSSGAQGLRILAENTWLAVSARRQKFDVVHHGVGTTPYIKGVPSVVTIHDIQYAHFPENFVLPKRTWLRSNVPMSVRSCGAVSVPSEWVKQDLVRRLATDPAKVVVVPFGSEHLFPEERPGPDEVRRRYGLDQEFFIFPGRSYPHKNHLMLVEAFEPLAGSAELVFTGPRWFLDERIESTVRSKGLAGRVRHLGLVSRAELAGLYEAAVALAYPTKFEGFGAPALEAMSLGTPVIASDRTAVPEVVGDGGILLDPDAVQAWTDTMWKVLKDSSLRAELSQRSLERAAEFTWQRSAELQVEAYRKAAGT